MVIFCDIDGTLTMTGGKAWGPPRINLIEKIKELIQEGSTVIIWSARGFKYASEFSKKYKIKPYAVLKKPDIMIDDNLEIRDFPRMKKFLPEQFLKEC